MEILDSLFLGLWFIVQILMVVLIGILILELFKRKKDRKGIFYFIILYFMVGLKIVLDNLVYFLSTPSDLLLKYITFSYFVPVIFAGITFYILWNKLNKKILFGLIGFIILMIGVNISLIFFDNLLVHILKFIALTGVIFSFYFLTMKYLIDTSGRKVLKVKGLKIKIFTKQRVLFLGIILIFGLIGSGVFLFKPSPKLASEINVYNWENFFGETTIEDFEREFGVKVNLETAISGAQMFEAVKKYPDKYDVVGLDDLSLNEMLNFELLTPLDKRHMPNLGNSLEICINEKISDYVAPYALISTLLIFNKKYIPPETDSWDILWNSNYAEKIGIVNAPQDVIMTTSLYLGQPLCPQDDLQFNNIKDFLFFQKPLVGAYGNYTQIMADLISEKIWAAQLYDGWAFRASQINKNLAYVLPKEGTFVGKTYFGIPSGSKNKYTAEIFINYLLRPEVGAGMSDTVGVQSCNLDADKFISSEFIGQYFDSEDLKKLHGVVECDSTVMMQKLGEGFWEELIEGGLE